jgi:hypothetical protein
MRLLRTITLALLAGACASSPGTVRTELEVYLHRTADWAPIEAETARTIERILRTQFVDEAEVRRQIDDSRPRILGHLERVRAYAPRAAPIAAIHTRYVQAWEGLLAGYDAIERGFSSGDYTQLARGRDAMGAWREGLIGVAASLRDLRQRVSPETNGVTESRVDPPGQLSTQST